MPGIGGFSWEQVKQAANRRCEQRGDSLDLDAELFVALQELCLESRWWWRRRVATFTLVAGQPQYDLTSATGFNAADLQQVAKNGLKLFSPGTPPTQPPPNPWQNNPWIGPEPVFDADEQDSIIVLQSSYPPTTPCRYFLKPGASTILWFDPIPDAAYPAALAYWAIPNYTADNAPQTIPLLPPWMQPTLIKKLEAQILAFLGEEFAEKYAAAMKEYGVGVERAKLYRQFADGFVNEFRTHSPQDAVQSTR